LVVHATQPNPRLHLRHVEAERRARSDSVKGLPMPSAHALTTAASHFDAESEAWIERLRAGNPGYEQALGELHASLLKAARFEVRRRRAALGDRYDSDHEDLAQQSADDALLAVLAKLDQFRGESRFTTWAYKFALYEAAVKVRRRAWQEREIQFEPEHWPLIADPGQTAHQDVETSELLVALADAIERDLSARQREILVAVTLNDVPIDVLAERLETTRGALYKTLHDARRKLRGSLAGRGLSLPSEGEVER
jgi:RNA polymerase sigma-70 factor (ECF subfamily)